MSDNKVSLVKCKSYDTAEVEEAVRRAVDLLGGIEKFIKPNERVLIKPNLLTDATPEQGIDTHPEVVRSVIRLIKPVTKNIYCGDSPSVWDKRRDVERVYETSGMKRVCGEEGVELVFFNKPKMVNSYPLTDWLDKCERIISVPKFKTHGFTILTAGIKNLFGLVIGMYKMKIHRDNPRPEDLSKALVDIYEIRKPDLNILDGVVAMEGEGPGTSGSLREMNLIAATSDALALDRILATIMGLEPCDIPTNNEAIKRGLGHRDIQDIDVLGEALKNYIIRDFKLPQTSILCRIPKWIIDIIKQFLRMKSAINHRKCQLCGLCQQSCPTEAVKMADRSIWIDYKKCILCLCCREICPHGAIEIKKSLLWRILSG